jgi:Protein of unknown function (DUF3147)
VATALLIFIKAVNGGVFVALFAVLGEMLQPKRFAGIFGASPAVALGNLLVIALVEGDVAARDAATGMIAGAVALAVACLVAIPAVRRWGAFGGSAILWAVWMAVGAAVAFPLAAGTAAGTGPPAGRRAGNGQGQAGRPERAGEQPQTPDGDGAHGDGAHGGRLFRVDFGALREIRPGTLVVRFAFGAAVSIVAGLIGIAAGKQAGGVMLAAPAVLPATLTIIERQEGRGAAVTEAIGSVPGAVALAGFALIAAASTARLPLAAALLCALAAWVVVAVGGYLIQGAVLPAWREEVRRLAGQRLGAAEGRRGQAAAGARRPSG